VSVTDAHEQYSIYIREFFFTHKRVEMNTSWCGSGSNEEVKGGVCVLVDQSSLGLAAIDSVCEA